jgi:hypothetical protein
VSFNNANILKNSCYGFYLSNCIVYDLTTSSYVPRKYKDSSALVSTNSNRVDLIKAEMLRCVYPVGSIYMSVVNNSPATFLGGTWAVWGTGRVAVAVNTGDSNFNTVEKTGGASTVALSTSQMPSHYHYLTDDKDTTHLYGNPASGSLNPGSFWFPNEYAIDNAFIHQNRSYTMRTDEVGGNAAHSNLQPYITCYMWKRTA